MSSAVLFRCLVAVVSRDRLHGDCCQCLCWWCCSVQACNNTQHAYRGCDCRSALRSTVGYRLHFSYVTPHQFFATVLPG